MLPPDENLYTFEYICSLPENERAELINGKILNMATPSILHQTIVSDIVYQLRSAIDKNNVECKVYPAPFGIKLNDTNFFEPDISLVCDKRKTENGKYCDGIPDLIMEVVSPSSVRNDYIIKLNKYIDANVFEYWVVDPIEKQILVYTLENNYIPKTYKITDSINVGIIRNCIIKLDI